MKLQELYGLFIELGRKNDPRSAEEIARVIKNNQKQFEEMKEMEKPYFDTEKLTNPYSDTRILNGDLQTEVHSILAGVDMETQEIVLADRLREKGEKIDLVLAHHPEGRAQAGLHNVMHMQEDILVELGVPVNVAEGMLASRISEVERNLLPLNHNRAVDAARLLNLPFMCVHTPADNMVNTFLTKYFEEKKPETLNDVVKLLKGLEEYHEAAKIGAGPKIVVGKGPNRTGKIFVDMTGGTGGSEDAFTKMAIAGVGTVICMHIGDKHRKKAEENHIHVIIAGHMASDSLGLNLLLDEAEKKGVKIIPCAGLTRVKRS
ncbi:MAG: NGG1p interacting factor NIF3 [Clostridia bacterium]|nr:NGG1p interacting factor NIF3 [Clostridia bacterium]